MTPSFTPYPSPCLPTSFHPLRDFPSNKFTKPGSLSAATPTVLKLRRPTHNTAREYFVRIRSKLIDASLRVMYSSANRLWHAHRTVKPSSNVEDPTSEVCHKGILPARLAKW